MRPPSFFEDESIYEKESGQCPQCEEKAELRTCAECGKSAWIIDCGHFSQPRPISTDDQSPFNHICDDCYQGR